MAPVGLCVMGEVAEGQSRVHRAPFSVTASNLRLWFGLLLSGRLPSGEIFLSLFSASTLSTDLSNEGVGGNQRCCFVVAPSRVPVHRKQLSCLTPFVVVFWLLNQRLDWALLSPGDTNLGILWPFVSDKG